MRSRITRVQAAATSARLHYGRALSSASCANSQGAKAVCVTSVVDSKGAKSQPGYFMVGVLGVCALAAAEWGMRETTHNESQSSALIQDGSLTSHSSAMDDAEGSTSPSSARGGRRLMLRSRTKHKAKMDEVDTIKLRLEEYKINRDQIDSLHARFDKFASKTAKNGQVKAMTFKDFLYSLVVPRFHLQDPPADIDYSCAFLGDSDGLITFEECYLLIHMLQIPQEHFDVAFHMFDLDGDGSVDKHEFSKVILTLLQSIDSKFQEEEGVELRDAEDVMPRLVKHLFGRYGSKKIKAKDLNLVFDSLRKQILRAEFDLYAKPHPRQKNQQAISVHDFAITLISCFEPERLGPYLERAHALHSSEELVTWEEFYNFHANVESYFDDIKLAFELMATDEITEADFIRAVRIVCGVELSFPVVQHAFRIFDADGNGTLDQTELMKVLEMRSKIQFHKKQSMSRMEQFMQCMRKKP